MMMYQITNRSKKTALAIICLGILILFCSNAIADDDVASSLKIPDENIRQILTLHDGTSLVGKITQVDSETIVFKSKLGESVIEIDNIKDIREVSEGRFKDGKFWYPNPNSTRLFFGPTGRTLKKGDGFFSDIYLFFPSVGYGFTDNFSISAGMSIFPGVNFNEQLIYFSPKFGKEINNNMSIAASAMIIRVPDIDDDNVITDDESYMVGVLFGTMTMGSTDKSLSLGLGFGFVDDEFSDNPAVQVGGEWRVGRRLSLVSENWIFPSIDEPIVSYGVRFLGEKLAIDLALFNVLSDDAIFPGIPYLDFVYNF